jgi:hypothetical protein
MKSAALVVTPAAALVLAKHYQLGHRMHPPYPNQDPTLRIGRRAHATPSAAQARAPEPTISKLAV